MPALTSDDERFSENDLERGRLLFAQNVEFLKGVAKLNQLPDEFATEIAFAGRSNVGKSSLLNALTNRRGIARTSNTPGRTRELNYFTIGDDFAMVDMPGYGYAKAEKALIAQWQKLVFAYLRGRPNLRRVFILIDSRHGLKPIDITTLDMLDETAVSYQIILTKADKLKKPEQDRIIEKTLKDIMKRPAAFPFLHLTSSTKNTGFEELRAEIFTLTVS